MKAYVLNKNKEPLMPTTPAIARILLKEGKAKVVKKTPFTIQLLNDSTGFKQPIAGGLDIGAVHLGCAAVSDKEVLYMSETLLEDDYTVKQKIQRRKGFRRLRRSRIRYRKPPYSRAMMVRLALQNRVAELKKSEVAELYPNFSKKRKVAFGDQSSFVAPSVQTKVNHHLQEMRRVEKILPVSRWVIETANFDLHKITNPEVAGVGYQYGPQYNFYNVKSYVLDRDGYKCQVCGASGIKKDGTVLNVHHIVPRRLSNSTDDPSNLITLCSSCHKKVHNNEVTLNAKPIKKGKRHATLANTVRARLIKALDCKNVLTTFGYQTKFKRQAILGLPKEHYFDAVSIAFDGTKKPKLSDTVYRIRRVPKNEYRRERRRKKTATSGKTYPEVKIRGRYNGYRKWDLVRYGDVTGFVRYLATNKSLVITDLDGNKLLSISSNKKPVILQAGSRYPTVIKKAQAHCIPQQIH